MLGIQAIRFGHKRFDNQKSINLIGFCFSDVGFTQSGSLDRIDNGKLVTGIKEKTNKVFGIDTGGFKTYD